MAIRAAFDRELSEERGGYAVVVQDDDHPEVEAVICFAALSDGRVEPEAIEVVLAPLRSARRGSFAPRVRRSPRVLTPSEIAELPWSAWIKAARLQARRKVTEHRELLRTVRTELRKPEPDGAGAVRRHRSRQRLARVAERYLGGQTAEQIGKAEKIAPTTARVLIHRARGAGLLPPREGKV